MKKRRERPNSMHGPPRPPPQTYTPLAPGETPTKVAIHVPVAEEKQMYSRLREHQQTPSGRILDTMILCVCDIAYILPPGETKPVGNKAPADATWAYTLHCHKPDEATKAFLEQMALEYPKREGTRIVVPY